MEQDLSPRKHEILDRVNDSIKEAMIAKQSDRLLALRNIKTEIINEEKKTGQSLDDTAITTLFKAMVKSREKANEIFTEQARPDLTENNSVEISIMSEYLPKKMSQEETKYALEDVMKAGKPLQQV